MFFLFVFSYLQAQEKAVSSHFGKEQCYSITDVLAHEILPYADVKGTL